jgi:uncharacterized phage protein (TIGR02220 family)
MLGFFIGKFMSNRRMFSKNIISSGSFIKMPSSSQLLYFHLALNADDDGVVEAFSVMRMISANDDDLKILAAKKFVTILNDDLVTFINDWLEHNSIRADRKVDSKYKTLLLQVISNIKLIEPRKRANRDNNTEVVRPMDDNLLAMDGEMSAQDRLGKDRLGKENTYMSTLQVDEHKSFKNIKYKKIVLQEVSFAKDAYGEEYTEIDYAPELRTIEPPASGQELTIFAQLVLKHLNWLTGKRFRPADSCLNPIKSIIKQGITLADFMIVHSRKYDEWHGKTNKEGVEMDSYMRPSTLYKKSLFFNYLGEAKR